MPVSKPVVKASSNSYANTVLLAAQSDSIKTRNKKLADAAAAFDKRSLGQRSVAHSRMARVVKRNSIEKRATKAAGTYYIIATDHLIDMPARALTGKIFKSRGITSTQLKIWKKVGDGDSSCPARPLTQNLFFFVLHRVRRTSNGASPRLKPP